MPPWGGNMLYTNYMAFPIIFLIRAPRALVNITTDLASVSRKF